MELAPFVGPVEDLPPELHGRSHEPVPLPVDHAPAEDEHALAEQHLDATLLARTERRQRPPVVHRVTGDAAHLQLDRHARPQPAEPRGSGGRVGVGCEPRVLRLGRQRPVVDVRHLTARVADGNGRQSLRAYQYDLEEVRAPALRRHQLHLEAVGRMERHLDRPRDHGRDLDLGGEEAARLDAQAVDRARHPAHHAATLRVRARALHSTRQDRRVANRRAGGIAHEVGHFAQVVDRDLSQFAVGRKGRTVEAQDQWTAPASEPQLERADLREGTGQLEVPGPVRPGVRPLRVGRVRLALRRSTLLRAMRRTRPSLGCSSRTPEA